MDEFALKAAAETDHRRSEVDENNAGSISILDEMIIAEMAVRSKLRECRCALVRIKIDSSTTQEQLKLAGNLVDLIRVCSQTLKTLQSCKPSKNY